MNILFVTREGFELAGGRIRCYDIVQRLKALGHKADVFSMSDTLKAKSGKKEHELTLFCKLLLNIKTFCKLLFLPRATVFIIQRVNYHSFAPALVSWLRGKPFILDLDDWEFSPTADLKAGPGCGSKALRLCRILAKKAAFCTASSDFLEKFLKQFNENTYKLASGVNLNRFPTQTKQHSAEEKEKKTVFGWLGTFFRQEDIDDLKMLLDIFADFIPRHTNCQLQICGDGIWAGHIKLMLQDYPQNVRDRVVFTGWIAPDEIVDFINGIDIALNPVAQPTRFNLSKCPVSLLEFMACATPVVSSATGEPANIIDNGLTGFTVNTPHDFAEKMLLLATNPQLRASIGKNARDKIVADYSTDMLAEKLVDIAEQNLKI